MAITTGCQDHSSMIGPASEKSRLSIHAGAQYEPGWICRLLTSLVRGLNTFIFQEQLYQQSLIPTYILENSKRLTSSISKSIVK